MNGKQTISLEEAKQTAAGIAATRNFEQFLDSLRQRFPATFATRLPSGVFERDYLRIVDHHLIHLLPQLQRYVTPTTRRVLDFGCGSGGSAIALCMVYPDVQCYGTDIDAEQIEVARERAKLYGVADRCEFRHIEESQPLPFPDDGFDFSQCSSVLEYVLDIKERTFCIREMVRTVANGGLLFFSVPNRIYPFEIHKRKWGWNYFPQRLGATIIDSSYWEVRKLASPSILRLHNTPAVQLFRPWTNFCLKKLAAQ
jgi:ubiquinone/menaquinone biosynthesis C-methylase UbiE